MEGHAKDIGVHTRVHTHTRAVPRTQCSIPQPCLWQGAVGAASIVTSGVRSGLAGVGEGEPRDRAAQPGMRREWAAPPDCTPTWTRSIQKSHTAMRAQTGPPQPGPRTPGQPSAGQGPPTGQGSKGRAPGPGPRTEGSCSVPAAAWSGSWGWTPTWQPSTWWRGGWGGQGRAGQWGAGRGGLEFQHGLCRYTACGCRCLWGPAV